MRGSLEIGGDVPRFFRIEGHFDVGPPLDWWQRLRWWAIRKLAGRNCTVLLNAMADERGSIKTDAHPLFLMSGCEDVRLISGANTGRQIYHLRPYNITEERW
jgi:hypothetical protein